MQLTIGVNAATTVTPGADPVAVARSAEAAGLDFISSNDHPCGTSPNRETWTQLVWIAAHTSRIKVATRVLGIPYRSPAMVAKMAETLDRMSEGRLILGLGGGYSDDEFRAFGMKVPSPREKIEGLKEGVKIVKGLWTQDAFSFPGRHHQTEGADIAPKPSHPIPIWLGTFRRRGLEVTGRVADGWIPSLSEDAPPERVAGMQSTIDAAARAAGRDPGEISSIYNVQIDLEGNSDDPFTLAGPAGEIIDRLAAFVEAGFTGFNLMPTGEAPVLEQIEALGSRVVAPLKTL